MAALWALGRFCVATSASWPAALVAVLDLAFLPVLAVFVLAPLLRARNRNTPLLAVLTALGLAALAAASIQLVRLAQWQGVRTLRIPIVWVLHLAYLWLALGLALKALALLAGAPFAAYYLHALTIGAATTMIMAVMTRATLGHTGRAMRVSRPTVCAYGLLTAAAVVRVFGPAWRTLPYAVVIVFAAALWTAAFVLFLWGLWADVAQAAR